MNGKELFRKYTLKQKEKVWKEMNANDRKLIQNLNNVARFPWTEWDFEIKYEQINTFEEIEEDRGAESDLEEDEKIEQENKEFKKLLIKLTERYIKVIKSQIKEYVEREGERILGEIKENYNKGTAEFIKQAGKTMEGRGLIKYLKEQW